MKDPAGIPALQDAIRHLYGLESSWLESVAVHEKHEGGTVWSGYVQVFEVDHPQTRRCYAWSHESGPGGRRKFHAVLGVSPVESAEAAVKTAVLAAANRASN